MKNALKMKNLREISWMWFCILCLWGRYARFRGIKIRLEREVKSKVLSIHGTMDVENVQFFMVLPWLILQRFLYA